MSVYEFLTDLFMPLFCGDDWMSTVLLNVTGNRVYTITAGNVFDVLYYVLLAWVVVHVFIILPYKILARIVKANNKKGGK